MELARLMVANAKSNTRAPRGPLSPPARFTLLLSIAAVVALLYAFCMAAVIMVVAMILFDLVILIVACRFPGLIGFIARPIAALAELGRAVIGSLFLNWGVQYRLPLRPGDALDLHYDIQRVATKMGVSRPREVYVDMSSGAYVELHGYRRGGYSILCLGYDLLVALDRTELEFVIAHELAHSKLSRRVYTRWLVGGLSRIARLHAATNEIVAECARQKKSFYLAATIAKTSETLGRIGSRLFGAYSREDEFAADQAAAIVCGPSVARETLLKLTATHRALDDIAWRDRVAQSQRGGSLTDWIASRLEVDDDERTDKERRALALDWTGDYDSHPSLPDRLAALPEEQHREHRFADAAITLLADPDGVGEKLIEEIERIAADQQRKHSQWTEKQTRKRIGERKYSDAQAVMVLVLVVFLAVFLALCLVDEQFAGKGLVTALCAMGVPLSIWAIWKLHPRELLRLPIPPMTLWDQTFEDEAERSSDCSWLAEVESELVSSVPPSPAGVEKPGLHWAKVSYEALGRCDYRRALAAAELSLKANKRCHEGLVAHSIAHKYYQHYDVCTESIKKAIAKHNVRNSLAVAFGWLFAFSGRWDEAEGYLLFALRDRKDDSYLLSMLSQCLAMNDKLLEAIDRSKRAVELAPDEPSHRQLLARILVSAGRTKEARSHIEILDNAGETTTDLLIAAVRTYLSLGERARAEDYQNRLMEADPDGHTLLNIGRAYAEAELDEVAVGYYERAAEAGHWPAAYTGLARIEHDRKNYDRAKQLLTSVLDSTREIAPDAQSPLSFVPFVCQAMMTMADPVDGCSAWTATIDLQDSPVDAAAMSLTIAAPNASAAGEHARWIYSAMHPGKELSDSLVKWKLAKPEDQPGGPVVPGIYGAEWS